MDASDDDDIIECRMATEMAREDGDGICARLKQQGTKKRIPK